MEDLVLSMLAEVEGEVRPPSSCCCWMEDASISLSNTQVPFTAHSTGYNLFKNLHL